MDGDDGCWMMDVGDEIWSARADQYDPVGQRKIDDDGISLPFS